MSFTSDIKAELCRIPSPDFSAAAAEMMGLMLFATRFDTDGMKIALSVPGMGKKVEQIIRKCTGIPDSRFLISETSLSLEGRELMEPIFDAIGYRFVSEALHVNFALTEEPETKSAFFRGAFLAGGYVSVSDNGYHLELVTHRFGVAKETKRLLLENDLPCGMVMRRGNHILYYKSSAVIEEFLTFMGASGSAMDIMLTKVEKDVNNQINRRVNCGTANLERTANASKEQLEAINSLKASGRFDTMPSNLKTTAEVRSNNPELSLSELCLLFDPPLTRSGLNNRLKKIIALSKE